MVFAFLIALLFHSCATVEQYAPDSIKKHIFKDEQKQTSESQSVDPIENEYNQVLLAQQENMQLLCDQKWTKRGQIDRRMAKYCLDKQLEAVRDIYNRKHEWKVKEFWFENENWQQEVWNLCHNKWTKRGLTDFNMVSYCLNQQNEGLLNIEYMLDNKKISKSQYVLCQMKWNVDRNMIVYCLKRE